MMSIPSPYYSCWDRDDWLQQVNNNVTKPNIKLKYAGCVTPFGIDPIWMVSANNIVY